MNLRTLFEELPEPGEGSHHALRFETVGVPGYKAYRLGKSPAGEPALLIVVKPGNPAAAAPIRLESITVLHDAHCTVSCGGEMSTATYSLVALTSPEPYLRYCFLDLLPVFVAKLGDAPSREEVSSALQSLVQLFRSVTKAPRTSVQGLWSELFLISTASNPEKLASSWHVDPNERFDFSDSDKRIEVKSAVGSRDHHFSHEQLSPSAGVEVVVVSYIVAPSTGGVSISGLLKRINAKLARTPDLQMRVIELSMALLGTSYADGSTQAFDEQLALDSTRYYDASRLPALGNIPPEISRIQFMMAMDGIVAESAATIAARGGLFKAAINN